MSACVCNLCKGVGEAQIQNRINVAENSYRKIPYKCPACDGKCMRPYQKQDNGEPYIANCRSCDAKGIIWG